MQIRLAWVAVVGLASGAAAQTVWYVDDNATAPGLGTSASPYASIQYAISRPTTVNGDTVFVAPGTYSERLDTLGKSISVMSAFGPAQTTIDAQSLGAGVVLNSGGGASTNLVGFRIVNGVGVDVLGVTYGGGVLCAGGMAAIQGCVIENCTANFGGGVAILGGATSVIQCVVRNNSAVSDFNAFITGEGGGLYLQGAVSALIQDTTIQQNVCDGSGAGILAVNSTVNMGVVAILDNLGVGSPFGPVGESGGGLATRGGGSAQVSNSTVARNTVLGGFNPSGGGVAAGSPVSLVGCIIEDNDAGDSASAGSGGGVVGHVTVFGCALRANYAEFFGGGAYGGSIQQSTIEGNCSSDGGGAYGSYLEDCTLRGNFGCGSASEEFGGGANQCTLVRCLVEGNSVAGHGGGAFNSTLTDCEVSNNAAYSAGAGYSGSGGGVEGGLATDCRIRGNLATGDTSFSGSTAGGGGAHGATLVRCAIYDNEATSGVESSNGGGAWNSTLTQCAVYDNQAAEGGGVFGGSADRCTIVSNSAQATGGGAESASLASCIVRANTNGQVRLCTVRYSNVQGGSAGIGNISGDPLFWNLAGRDLNLRPGSPCINSGDPAAPLDSDGTRADMGAFPFDPNHCTSPVVYCSSKTNSLGCEPSIGWSGAPRLSGPDQFDVTASNVLGARVGLLFWGYQPDATPFQGGYLCVLPPTLRTPAQLSTGAFNACNGVYSHHFSQSYMTQNALVAGGEVCMQWWMRDPASASATGLSNALKVTVCP